MIGRDMLLQLKQALRPIKQRIHSMIARAAVTVVQDASAIQTMQVEVHKDEFVEDAKHFQGYGFSSVPISGARAVVIFPDGDRARPLVIGLDDPRHRPTGSAPGEVVIYTDEGDEIRLGRGRIITFAAGSRINLGGASASDPIARQSDLQIIKDAFDKHVHTTTATVGATIVPGVLSTPSNGLTPPVFITMPLPPGSSKVFDE